LSKNVISYENINFAQENLQFAFLLHFYLTFENLFKSKFLLQQKLPPQLELLWWY